MITPVPPQPIPDPGELAATRRALEKAEEIVQWRKRYLERSGYDTEAAELIARDTKVDLHRAGELLEKGCDPTTALLILL